MARLEGVPVHTGRAGRAADPRGHEPRPRQLHADPRGLSFLPPRARGSAAARRGTTPPRPRPAPAAAHFRRRRLRGGTGADGHLRRPTALQAKADPKVLPLKYTLAEVAKHCDGGRRVGRDRRARVRRDAVHRAPPGRRRPDRRGGGEGLAPTSSPTTTRRGSAETTLPASSSARWRRARSSWLAASPTSAGSARSSSAAASSTTSMGYYAKTAAWHAVHAARRAVPLARRRVVRHADGGRRGDGALLAAVCWYRPRPRPLGRDAFVLQGPRDRLAPLRRHGLPRSAGGSRATTRTTRRVQRDRARPRHPAHAGARDHVEDLFARARLGHVPPQVGGDGRRGSRPRVVPALLLLPGAARHRPVEPVRAAGCST